MQPNRYWTKVYRLQQTQSKDGNACVREDFTTPEESDQYWAGYEIDDASEDTTDGRKETKERVTFVIRNWVELSVTDRLQEKIYGGVYKIISIKYGENELIVKAETL